MAGNHADHAHEMSAQEKHEAGVEHEEYCSQSHTPDAPLFADSLFDFLMYMRKNTDTFDPLYYNRNLVSGDPMDAPLARSIVQEYTGEPTDLLTEEDLAGLSGQLVPSKRGAHI